MKGVRIGMGESGRETKLSLATFGAGCFWCVEAVFQRLEGVVKVAPGYSGGRVEAPAYEQVCSGTTGHAEVCQISYDAERVSYGKLLDVFWKTHDPTTLNRQGNDVGSQYRSVIFYHGPDQKALAEESLAKLDSEGVWDRPVVTQIVPFERFWPAEDYHKDYFKRNPDAGYCLFVIAPKVDKFKKSFNDVMKEGY